MKLYPIEAGNFKLDGGAMFGVVPKSIWQKTNPADQNNQIPLATRCLLIENGDQLILIDTGMGNKQSEKFYGYYHLWGDFSLLSSLKKAGFHPDDITDVFLTHLHFDHCGGAIITNNNGSLQPLFKNAKYWSNQAHWQWAIAPNPREKASFLKENILPIEESGQLHLIDPVKGSFIENTALNFGVTFVNGHTDKQMLPHIQYKDKVIVFVADLLPTVGHIPLPYVMSYDIRPLVTVDEKKEFLEKAADQNWYLFLEHDAHHEIITVKRTDRGIRLHETYTCNEIFN
ncbi:MBL fold metallo-hydrolase [Aquimarina sp. ERC-38]|uniref:MBL fold metallo-hydrolase n=1 Tax=Aquimarina sp. ERC-38 TaxID=2949996 RepID=UPI0022463014|nr:MBL fold metallo-hydrolase [Aquimarina sp. ERC-38]UZO81820.1 MBL fold metallo-hydrolase [Aquimarina sp. ERC-38]